MSKRTTAAVWVKGIAEMLAAEGMDPCALLAAAGIEPAALDTQGARLPTEKISRLWELAAERSGNPAIGLAQHHVVRPASFDVVGYTMMSCADLRGAFERLIRYLLILSDALTMTMSEERDGYRVTFVLFGGDRPVPRQRIEFIFVTVIGFCRWISGRNVHPWAIELPYPAPLDPAPYRAAFRCPVSFDAPRCSLLFGGADMAAPLPTSNPQLAEMHERTLQRRLEQEATSFVQLLDDTRRELAEQCLGRLHLSLAQAAYLLGFADQRSFFRACRRWFHVSPGQYRSRLSRLPVEQPGTS